MPRNNRRPRRSSKKSKDNEIDQENGLENAIQLIDTPIDHTIQEDSIENKEFENGNNSGNYETDIKYKNRPLDIDPASFGLVEPDLKIYFKNLERLIDNKDEVPDDLELLIERGFEEMKGHEFQLVVDHECSRILEKMSMLAPTYRIIHLLSILNDKILTLLTHRFASHVCQTLITLSAEVVERECLGQSIKLPESLKEEITSLPTMESIIISITKSLSGRWSELIFNTFASHVLRVLLQVIHGAPIIEENTTSNTVIKSKKSKKYMQSKTESDFIAPTLERAYKVPNSFKLLIQSIQKELIIDVPETILRSTVLHTTASPVLQMLLCIEAKRSDFNSVDQLVNQLLQGIPNEEEIAKQGIKLKNPYVETIIKDSVGSHLFEKILKVISNSMFNRIYQLYFRNKLLDLSFHSTSNFVVQKLIVNVKSQAQLQSILDELMPSFERILRSNRPGIVRSVLDACLNLKCCYKEVLKGVTQAFQINTPNEQKDFIHVCLRMLSYKTFKEIQFKEKPRYHQQGSLILQTILQFPEPHNALVINSILSQSTSILLELANDPIANHIIDLLFKLKEIPYKVKRKILLNLNGFYYKLAMDKMGSRILDTCWSIADIQMKESIAMELVQHETLLANHFFGKFALRNCRIEHFKYKKSLWLQHEKKLENRKQMVLDLFDENEKEIAFKKKENNSILDSRLPKKLENVVNKETLGLLKGSEQTEIPKIEVMSEDIQINEIDQLFNSVKKSSNLKFDDDDTSDEEVQEENLVESSIKNKKKDNSTNQGISEVLEALDNLKGKEKKIKKKDSKHEKKKKKDKSILNEEQKLKRKLDKEEKLKMLVKETSLLAKKDKKNKNKKSKLD